MMWGGAKDQSKFNPDVYLLATSIVFFLRFFFGLAFWRIHVIIVFWQPTGTCLCGLELFFLFLRRRLFISTESASPTSCASAAAGGVGVATHRVFLQIPYALDLETPNTSPIF